MFQSRIRCSLPDTTNKRNHTDLEEQLEFNNRTKKELATDYATLHHHTKLCSLSIGDGVLVKQPRKNKLSSPFGPNLYRIIAQEGLEPKTRKLIMKLLEITLILSRYLIKQLYHLLYQILKEREKG